jgi:hypothetical protein
MKISATNVFLLFVAMANTLALVGCVEADAPISEDESARSHETLLEFRSPVWGQSIEDIQARHADGTVTRIAEDETHYRVLAKAYGLPVVLVTFCFRESLGLHHVVVNVPSDSAPVDLSTGSFARLDTETGRTRLNIVRDALETAYGSATHTSRNETTGELNVYGGKYGQFARLDAARIGNDQLDVVVWYANRSSDTYESDEDKLIAAGLWRTDPDEWVGPPVFDTLWGMGSGDVRDVYHSLSVVLPDPTDVVKDYGTDEFIEGAVGLQFEFFQGRLVGMVLSPVLHSGELFGDESETNEEKWRRWDWWRSSVMSVLREKYGEPRARHESTIFDDDSKPETTPNAWYWSSTTTAIRMRMVGRIPYLEYRELASLEAREKAERSAKQQEEQSRKDQF